MRTTACLLSAGGTDRLDATPLLEYFQPLYVWRKSQNTHNHSKPGWRPAASHGRS